MSLALEKSDASLTVFGYGWDDSVIDSGVAETEEGLALEDFSYDLDYDFDSDFDWEALADDLNISLDLDGNIDLTQQEDLSQELSDLSQDEDAIYNYMVDHDPSEGVPARIRIIQLPDKLEYNDGDTIDFTGIIVAAYASLTTRTPFIMEGAEGPHQNQIPFEELRFPVTQVKFEGLQYYLVDSDISISGIESEITYFKNKLSYARPDGVSFRTHTLTGNARATFISNKYSGTPANGAILVASDSPDDCCEYRYNETDDPGDVWTLSLSKSYTYEGKTVYYHWHRNWLSFNLIDESPPEAFKAITWKAKYYSWDLIPAGLIAWVMMYGEAKSNGGQLTVPVQWSTDYQAEPYEDSFEIQSGKG